MQLPIILTILSGATLIIGSNILLEQHRGNLFFYDNTYTIELNLGLKEYYTNGLILYNCIKTLTTLCNDNKKINKCEYLRKNIRDATELAKNDITYIKQLAKTKRELLTIGIVVLVTAVMDLMAGVAVSQNEVAELKNKEDLHRKIIKEQLNITEASLHIQREMFTDASKEINNLKTELEKTNNEAKANENFNDILDIATLAIIKHNQDTRKFLTALTGDISEQFFNIINIEEFSEKLKTINNTLPKGLTLPNIDTCNILEICRITTKSNTTNIKITIKIPLINKKKYELTELIPIPIKRNNETIILDSNTKFIITRNNLSFEIRPKTFSKCLNAQNITLCNTMHIPELNTLDKCTNSLQKNETERECVFNTIANENQFIKIGPNSLYCFIIKPTQLKITCSEKEKIYNLTESKIISYREQCETYIIIDKKYNETFVKQITIDNHPIQPDFSIFNTKKNNWSHNIQIINPYNDKIDTLIKKIKIAENQLTKPISTPKTNWWTYITMALKNKLIEMTIYIMGSIIAILLITKITTYLWKKI